MRDALRRFAWGGLVGAWLACGAVWLWFVLAR